MTILSQFNRLAEFYWKNSSQKLAWQSFTTSIPDRLTPGFYLTNDKIPFQSCKIGRNEKKGSRKNPATATASTETTASISPTPTATITDYTVTATDVNSCTGMAVATITVNVPGAEKRFWEEIF